MRGFGKGSYAKMKQNAIEAYSGYLQIQKKGYWDDKNINNSFTIDSELLDQFEARSEVKNLIPRLESFSLASSGEATKGAVIMGIEPESENKMSEIANYLSEGEYLSEKDSSVLLAQDLASFLRINVDGLQRFQFHCSILLDRNVTSVDTFDIVVGPVQFDQSLLLEVQHPHTSRFQKVECQILSTWRRLDLTFTQTKVIEHRLTHPCLGYPQDKACKGAR